MSAGSIGRLNYPPNGGGGVSGLTSADGGAALADNKIVRGDGPTGIQGSAVDISDAGAVTGATLLEVDNLRLDGNVLASRNANGNIDVTPNGAGQATFPAGTLTVPGLAFTADLTRGLSAAGGGVTFILAAAHVWALDSAGNMVLDSGKQAGWSNGTPLGGSLDTGERRISAGVILDTNGSAGVGSRLTGRPVEASTAGSGAPNLLTATESRKLLTNEGAAAEAYNTLPSAVTGYEFVFYCQDADGIRVVANAGDTVRLGGAVSAAAGFVRSAVAGSSITLVSINATEWVATSIVGTWTVDL